MSTRISDAQPSALDALLMIGVVTVVSLLMTVIWVSARGRYAVEPSPVTTAVAPNSTPVIATIEEDPQ